MTTLQMLADEREISRGLAHFARVLDRKQWDALTEVFATGVIFNYGSGGEQRGIAALGQQMRRYLDVCGGTQHLIGSITIDIDGDSALSRAYVQARHQRINDMGGPVFDANGEYVDKWQRCPEGWRIVRRDAIWLTQSGHAAVLAADSGDLA